MTETLKNLQAFGVPACSALSVLEVQVGVRKGEGEKTDAFLSSLRVLNVSREIANKAAQLVREGKSKGITVDLPDAVIAGTSILHHLTLVTYNLKHYPFEEMKFHLLPSL